MPNGVPNYQNAYGLLIMGNLIIPN